MKKRKPNDIKVRKRISDCKRRLDNLKKQGFHFSQDVYDDLESVKGKILQASLIYRMWNKKIRIAGIISIFVVIFVLYLLLFQNEICVQINNIEDGMVIYENLEIFGTVSNKNRWIPLFQVNSFSSLKIGIDNYILDFVNVTDGSWSFFFNITNLKDGMNNLSFDEMHKLSFQFYDGKFYSTPITKNIFIQSTSAKPRVLIQDPRDLETVSDIVNITGNAYTAIGEISRVQIIFEQNSEITVRNVSQIDENSWYYIWDSTNFQNGNCNISVISFDSNSNKSKEFLIHVYIDNEVIPDTDPEIPSITNSKYFQLYFYDLEEKTKPNKTFRIHGIHRLISRPVWQYLNFNLLTTIKVTQKPDWINVDILQPQLITPPDGEIHDFSINISISDTAPKERKGVITFFCTTGFDVNIFPTPETQSFMWAILQKNTYSDDVWIKTGTWE